MSLVGRDPGSKTSGKLGATATASNACRRRLRAGETSFSMRTEWSGS